LTLDEIAQLVEAFTESDLPYKVDVVDWHGIDERFRQTIMAQRQELGGFARDGVRRGVTKQSR